LNSADENPNARIAALEAELDSVKRRDAEFRAKIVHEFLDKGERNTYLHTLHEERAALIRRQQESFADLEVLVRRLEAADSRVGELENQLASVWGSWSWRLTAPLRTVRRVLAPGSVARDVKSLIAPPPVEGAIFIYYLHTSPFRIYRGETFTITGWAWPADGSAVSAIRASVDGRTFTGRHGLEEPEVIAKHGPQAKNPRPGFEVTFETRPGRHLLSIEALVEGAGWRWLLRTPIWCEPSRT
jgi:hypothetical protein